MADKIAERVASLNQLSPSEIDELQYDCESTFRTLILESKKGSEERYRQFSHAYKLLIPILMERRRREGRRVTDSLGFSPFLVTALKEQLGPPPRRILDVGCGTGMLMQEMARLGYSADGIDLSEECITIGRSRAPENAKLICGNFLTHDFGKGAYDLVHTNDVIEHLHPDEVNDFLKKCFSLLKPGGIFWLVTINKWTGPGDATTIKHPFGTETRGLHLKEYSLAEMNERIRRAGFHGLSARLMTPGKLRKGTDYRRVYLTIKLLLEKGLRFLPYKVRSRLMWAMVFSEIVARKK